MLKAIINFLNEVKAELNKVVWPSREQTIKLTAVVILASIIVALYIGALDISFTKLVNILLSA